MTLITTTDVADFKDKLLLEDRAQFQTFEEGRLEGKTSLQAAMDATGMASRGLAIVIVMSLFRVSKGGAERHKGFIV